MFQNFKKIPYIEILSGLTVALALVPEAISFAFIAGVGPMVGLYAALLVCMITSLFGGRPGMISGATGALAVVMVNLVKKHGVEYLFATVILMGVIQVIFGIFKLGKFIRMVPYPVMLGFVNGLAIVIFLAQFSQFQFTDDSGQKRWMYGQSLYIMLILSLATMLISKVISSVSSKIPGPLCAIIITSLAVIIFDIPTKTVADMASIRGSLPQFAIPEVGFTIETLLIIAPYAFILAAIGIIESLLTLTLIDEMTDTKGRNSRECMAQGLANFVTGFFGGMGGCAMIGQSMINIKSGGRQRLSGVAVALFLLLFILFLYPWIEKIPVASLVGVMFVVVISTFEWSSFRIIRKIPKKDAITLIAVSMITVFTDLAIAVVSGVVISALTFCWESAKNLRITTTYDNTTHDSTTHDRGANAKIYHINGHLFFASVQLFKSHFTFNFKESTRESRQDVILDFHNCRVWDHSALKAIDDIVKKFSNCGVKIKLVHLSKDCRELLDRGSDLVVINADEDPHYGLIVDYKNKPGGKI